MSYSLGFLNFLFIAAFLLYKSKQEFLSGAFTDIFQALREVKVQASDGIGQTTDGGMNVRVLGESKWYTDLYLQSLDSCPHGETFSLYERKRLQVL